MVDLSIILVNWNTKELLRDCLRSVFENMDDINAEVIVIDNGSTDGSPEMVAREFPDVKLIRNQSNRGFAAANNQGMADLIARYVLLLNSDTVIHGKVLQESIRFMDANPDVGVMGCRVLNHDGTMQPTCSQYPSLLNLLLLTSGLSRLPWPKFLDRYQMRRWPRTDERDVDVVSGCYMLVRSAAIREVGLLDEDFFFFGEETDWCSRFKAKGWKLRFAPVGEITHFGGGSVKKLNHVRDLMLTSATIKLHRKHSGVGSAAAAWAILFVFNFSRMVYWSSASLMLRSESARERRNHFYHLIRNYRSAWPTGRTASF